MEWARYPSRVRAVAARERQPEHRGWVWRVWYRPAERYAGAPWALVPLRRFEADREPADDFD